MKLKYRTERNAQAVAKYWNLDLSKPDWFSIKAAADGVTEILIYDYIGWPYNDPIDLIAALAEAGDGKVLVRINSPGGDVFDAMAIYNALADSRATITTRVEGLAASAASFVMLAGREVHAYKNTMIMIHEPWAYLAGNQHELRDSADVLEMITENMVDIYVAKSNQAGAAIRKMLKAETWFNAKEAKKIGFIGKIVEGGKEAKATFDLSIFANAPKNGDSEPTERDIEKLLRDAGVSRADAKAMIAGGKHHAKAETLKEIADAMRKTITVLTT